MKKNKNHGCALIKCRCDVLFVDVTFFRGHLLTDFSVLFLPIFFQLK